MDSAPTFRDWSGEVSSFPREVAEMALAHAIENKVEAAYRRGDLFEKRRKMMQEWAEYLEGLRAGENADPTRAGMSMPTVGSDSLLARLAEPV